MADQSQVTIDTSFASFDRAKSGATQNTLAAKARAGVFWVTGLNFFRDLLQFGVMLVLVRLLDPKAYGQFSLVTSFIGFFTVLSFRSFLEQTLQVRPNEEVDYQTHFTAAGAIQLGLFSIFNLVAVVLRKFGQYSEIAPLLNVMSVFFLLDWASEFRVKMLERALEWKRLRLLQGVGVVLNASAAILLALTGVGVYALLVPGLMVTLPFIYDLFVVSAWRPTWKWNAKHFVAARRYGLTRIASGLALTSRQLLESNMVVQFIGFSSFGIYGRAIGLANIACLKFPTLLMLAVYPVLGKVERNTASYRKLNGLVLRVVAWSVIPIAVLFSLIAGPLVKLLYGAKWLDAIPLVPWALIVGVMSALIWTSSLLLLANVQQKRCLISDLLSLLGTGLSLFLMLPRGLRYYLAGVALTQVVCLAIMLVSLCQACAIDVGSIVHALVLPLPSVLAATSSLVCLQFYSGLSLVGLASVVGYSATFLFVYLLVLRFTSATPLRELIHYCPGRKYLSKVLLLSQC